MKREPRACLLVWIAQNQWNARAYHSKTAARRAVEAMQPRPKFIIADNGTYCGTYEEFAAIAAEQYPVPVEAEVEKEKEQDREDKNED